MDLVQAFRDACKDPLAHQEQLLLDIFRAHVGVHALEGKQLPTSTGEALRLLAELPITTYADYEPHVKAMLAAADSGSTEAFQAACKRMSGQPVTAVHLTSGTTGASKMLPDSDRLTGLRMKAFGLVSAATKAKMPSGPGTKTLNFTFAGPVTTFANGLHMGSSSSVNLNKFARLIKSNDPAGAGMRAMASQRTHPFELTVETVGSPSAKFYCAWLCAIAQAAEVGQITDIFAGNTLLACGVLQQQWAAIADDLRAGRVSPAVVISDDTRAAVDAKLGGQRPEAAAQLEAAVAAGSEGLLERLFPNLTSVGVIVTGSHAKYVPQLRKLLPSVPISAGLYGATECYVGVCHELVKEGPWGIEPGRDGEQAFVLFPDCDCYLEFLPVGEASSADAAGGDAVGSGPAPAGSSGNGAGRNGASACDAGSSSNGSGHAGNASGEAGSNGVVGANGTTAAAADDASRLVAMDGLQLGRRYQVVVTSMVPLFRYNMGEVVRVVDYFEKTPVVAFEGRTGQVLNLVWEKMLESQVVAALTGALPPLLDFTCLEDTTDALRKHYVVYVELPPAHSVLPAAADSSAIATEAAPEAAPDVQQPADGKSPSGNNSNVNAGSVAEWAAALEHALRCHNVVYGQLAFSGAIAPVQLRIVGPGAFEALRQRLLEARGTSGSQYKTPTVLRDSELVALMDSRVVVQASGDSKGLVQAVGVNGNSGV